MGIYFLDIQYVKEVLIHFMYTVCLRSSYLHYVVSYYIKWVTTSWTHSSYSEYMYIKVMTNYAQFL